MVTLVTPTFRGSNKLTSRYSWVLCYTVYDMKIAVIGASGKTGRVFVNAALGAGHDIRAGVYRSEVFHTSDHLEVVKIDALKPADVEKLVVGCDAVVSVLGHVHDSPAYVQTTAIGNVLSAMKKHRIRRIVSLTGTGVRTKGDRPSWTDRILNLAVRVADPARVHDGKAHADVLKDSDTEWTVVRVLKLTDGLEQLYSLTAHGPGKAFVTRRTAADAILRVLNDHSFVRELPVLSRAQRVL